MRDLESEAVARLVQHPNVQSRKWKSPYDIYDWQLVSKIPWKLQPAIKMVKRVLDPLQGWEVEAFRVEEDTILCTELHLALNSVGLAHLNTPAFGRPTLKLNEILSWPFRSLAEKVPLHLRYREFLKVEFPAIFYLQPDGENSDNVLPGLVPAYDKLVIKPFWLFEGEGEKERAVAEDPFRVVLNIYGAPISYIRYELGELGVNEERLASVLFKGKKLA